ncbi:MAG TPA: flagellar basal-body MS-ring/collar protein FliF [Gemmatimonadales bacterium]|nr:flagellar basal-body MS-ring/collar protein FliF [Gemmatimonadales bacterium]
MATPLPPVVADAVRRMNGTRRFLGLGIIAGALALLWVASGWATRSSYVPLYRDLELGATGTMTDDLTKGGIPFRLEDGGATVMVPEAELARARVLLAKDGLPANGRPGLELFDKPAWGMTDFTQRITYRRALEGELSRTIGTLRGVERAQVHLALPESSPLRKMERPAEAAVVVTLKNGASLAPEVVQGIAYIVSNSVEQLASENVAVMDDSGRVLSVPSDNGGMFGLSTRQLELQRSVERQLGGKVEALLGTVVGAGAARVQVSAALNFEQVDRTIESYDPDGAVLGTEQRSETTGNEDEGTGAQTVISNAYQNSRKVERIIGSVGNIKRLTVAVLVDQKALGTTPVAGLDSAVRNAIGIDTTRGDRLTVTVMPFGDAAAAGLQGLSADSSGSGKDVLVIVERFSRPGIMVLGIVAALILGLRLLKPVSIPAGAVTAGTVAAGALSSAPAPAFAELPDVPPSVSMQLRNKVQSESADQPQMAAQVMRAWLAEG